MSHTIDFNDLISKRKKIDEKGHSMSTTCLQKDFEAVWEGEKKTAKENTCMVIAKQGLTERPLGVPLRMNNSVQPTIFLLRHGSLPCLEAEVAAPCSTQSSSVYWRTAESLVSDPVVVKINDQNHALQNHKIL
ncbi:hypothetical protein CAPTEDRAFT_196556 [Capitella teleta]|uniref:Uncharacterized protein n=1 Tax=Capitella teleta TaxID=283909 RepID=R7TBX9_CAPTE|nr:hypothetical protein CAPTEDRAFT_196556 [Capitella teleta]|eukprot:ELT88601.1 hypothetical protein CAPTEDRAFT_196556 [Capitella teleta]